MRIRLTLASIAALVAAFANLNAQSLHGFRFLKLDGEYVVWSTWEGEPKAANVTYAFVRSRTETPDAVNCSTMGPIDPLLQKSKLDRGAFQAEVRAAFDMWQSVANITFTEIADPNEAGILIGAQLEPFGRAFTNVSYKSDSAEPRPIKRSLICFNPEQRWKIGFDGNLEVYDVRYTMAHEIGHAIGLDHPMSAGQLMHHRYAERFRTLQEGDIEGVALLYGLRERPAPAKPQHEIHSVSVTQTAASE
ncbi:MAG TPA: matrixin family metalloprotease [Hyphomicrobiaceae bacterium]